MKKPDRYHLEHYCTECGMPAIVADRRITVPHAPACPIRPGGPRWQAAVAALRQVTAARPATVRLT